MKKINILILKSYLGPLVMTFFIALFILIMQFLWKYIDDLVGKGLEWHLIARLLFYASATFIPLALPLAILLSSLMTFGNLGEHYELVAMKSAGISLQKAMKPLIILSVFISLFAFYFSNNILPIANLKFQTLYYNIREKKLAFNIKEEIFYNDLDGYTIRVGKKDKDGIHIEDVLIYNHTGQLGNIDVTTAKSGKMEMTPDGKYMIFSLFDGQNYKEVVDAQGYRKSRPFERSVFKEEIKKFNMTEFNIGHTDENVFKSNYMMLNIKQLAYSIDSLNKIKKGQEEKLLNSFDANFRYYNKLDSSALTEKDTISFRGLLSGLSKTDRHDLMDKSYYNAQSIFNEINYEYDELKRRKQEITRFIITIHEKFTLSFACLILFFIGAPMGAIIRKGGLGFPVVISVIFFILFHIASITGKKYVIAGLLVPGIGMWIASAILLPIGIFLTYKATIDAPLLDADNWRKIFRMMTKLVNKDG